MRLAIILALASLAVCEGYYEGYHVVKVKPEDEHQVEWLMQLEKQEGLDFLKSTRSTRHEAEILVTKDKVEEFYKTLINFNMRYHTISKDASKEVKQFFEARKNKPKAFDINDFNTFDDILTGLTEMAGNCPSGYSCDFEDIGTTHLNRPIRLLKITKPGNRDIIWFDSAIHAREWLAPATNLKLLDAVISQSNADAVNLLNKYDFYFLIVLNPDGYVYSWTDERFWRKNRSPNTICVGTDLNRNYDVFWGQDGTSTNECVDTYGGARAASELETQAFQNYIRNIGSRVRMLTTIHSTAYMILIPYGNTDSITGACARSDDYNDQISAANAYADGIEGVSGDAWSRGPVCETIYPASGSSMDYAHASGNVKYAFTPELRGPGFDPPASAIQPSYEEIWKGFVDAIAKIEEIEG